MITLDSVYVNLGYGLMLLALLARDMLWLRATLIVAQSLLCTYALHTGAPNVAAWNALFVAINIIQVIRILMERRRIILAEPLASIHALNFDVMTVPEFLGLWRRAEECREVTGELLAEGVANERLILLVAGQVRVLVQDQEVARLGPGRLVAEMSYLTQEPTSASVVADEPVTYRAWSRDTLDRIKRNRPALWSKLQAAIGRDLVRKIRQVDAQAGTAPASRGNTTT